MHNTLDALVFHLLKRYNTSLHIEMHIGLSLIFMCMDHNHIKALISKAFSRLLKMLEKG